MGDGSLQNRGLYLSIYGFSYNEVILKKNTLENIFINKDKIKCIIYNHKKGYRIYIWQENLNIIIEYISQYMHKDMLYKITHKNL